MHFDSYRWQDHVQNHYRRGIDLALTGVFAALLWAGAVLQHIDTQGLAPAADPLTTQTAQIRALPDCGA